MAFQCQELVKFMMSFKFYHLKHCYLSVSVVCLFLLIVGSSDKKMLVTECKVMYFAIIISFGYIANA
jgi:hypothetical protein